jgi:hypothetical protein
MYQEAASLSQMLVPSHQTTAQKTAVFSQTKRFWFVMMPNKRAI